jgi:hypothetical protein
MRQGQAAACAAVLLTVCACGGSASNPLQLSQAGTPVNRIPAVTNIVATPAIVDPGAAGVVVVTAADPDGDALTYEYSSDHGAVPGGTQGSTVPYTAGPERIQFDTVRVTVRDSRGGVVTSAISIGISPNAPPIGVNPFPRPGDATSPSPAPQPTPRPDPSSTPEPNPSPKPTPSPTPSPMPTPTPTPMPTPTPTPAPNRPPTIDSITGDGGSCHPAAGQACSVALTANASDPDGDPLSYSWSGCASGTGRTASCTVGSLGAVAATVHVTDARGASANGNASASGKNAAPGVNCPGDTSVHWGTQITVPVESFDADGDSLDCGASTPGGSEDVPGAVNSSDCSSVTLTTCANNSGSSNCFDRFTVNVSDGYSSAQCTFKVTGTYK